jgi:hypothetical protein
MSYAVINIEDPAGKFVGRRKLWGAWKLGMEAQKTGNELRRSSAHRGALLSEGCFPLQIP